MVNILIGRIAISCKWSRDPKETYVNQQIATAVLLQLGKDLIDKNGFLVETIDKTLPQGKLRNALQIVSNVLF